MKQKRTDGVFPGQGPGIGDGLTAASALLAHGHTDTQQQVTWLGYGAQLRQRPLRLAQRFPFLGAVGTLVEVGSDLVHLPSVQASVKIL